MGLTDILQNPDVGMALRLLAAAGPQAQPMSFGQRAFGAIQGQQQDELNRQLTLARIAAMHQQSKSSGKGKYKYTMSDRLMYLGNRIANKKATKEETKEFDLLRSANAQALLMNPIYRTVSWEMEENNKANKKNKPKVIDTQEEYDALPSGAKYIDMKTMKMATKP